MPWPGDSEGTFRSSSQAATRPPVYHTRRRLHTVPLIAERQVGKLWIPIFIVFGLTQPGIEPESTASVADGLSTRPPVESKFQLAKFYWLLVMRHEFVRSFNPHLTKIANKNQRYYALTRSPNYSYWHLNSTHAFKQSVCLVN